MMPLQHGFVQPGSEPEASAAVILLDLLESAGETARSGWPRGLRQIYKVQALLKCFVLAAHWLIPERPAILVTHRPQPTRL
jgi:hypothetical protein